MTLGRPPKYTDPNEMQYLIDLYFIGCKLNKAQDDTAIELIKSGLSADSMLIINDIECEIPTVSGLAYLLNMSTESFRNYEQNDDFLATVKRAKQRIEMSLENRLAGNNVTGAIFNLKNNFKWKDKTESEHTGPDGGPIQTTVNFIPVSNKEK